MKKPYFIITLLSFFFITSFAFSNNNSNNKFKEIVREANLLYQYEKVAWNSSDYFVNQKEMVSACGDFLVYHTDSLIHSVFIDKLKNNRIAKYTFKYNDLEQPIEETFDFTKLTDYEKDLFNKKQKILNQIAKNNYKIEVLEKFKPNIVLLKSSNTYKLYIIMGTSESGIIPFGNDYRFTADKNGSLIKMEKLHTQLHPIKIESRNNERVESKLHTHISPEPHITATDICTFRLYADLYGLNEFIVPSIDNKKNYKYSIDDNIIKILNK
jgi:hypothetical protein